MLTIAAREDSIPRAPRSHSLRARMSNRARITRGVCSLAIVAACGADAGVAPTSATPATPTRTPYVFTESCPFWPSTSAFGGTASS